MEAKWGPNRTFVCLGAREVKQRLFVVIDGSFAENKGFFQRGVFVVYIILRAMLIGPMHPFFEQNRAEKRGTTFESIFCVLQEKRFVFIYVKLAYINWVNVGLQKMLNYKACGYDIHKG